MADRRFTIQGWLDTDKRDEETKALAIKGVRAVRNVLGDQLGATAKRAEEAAHKLAEADEPVVLGGTDREDTALSAVQAAVLESKGVLLVEVALSPEAAEEAAGDAGSMRVFKVYVDEKGEQYFGMDREAVTEKDAVLVEDIDDPIMRNPFSWEACATAMVALAAASGTLSLPSKANVYMSSFALNGGEPELWLEAMHALKIVFPGDAPPPEIVEIEDPTDPESVA